MIVIKADNTQLHGSVNHIVDQIFAMKQPVRIMAGSKFISDWKPSFSTSSLAEDNRLWLYQMLKSIIREQQR